MPAKKEGYVSSGGWSITKAIFDKFKEICRKDHRTQREEFEWLIEKRYTEIQREGKK